MPSRIYLDHNASSPLLAQAHEAITLALAASARPWGNASSPHAPGQAARVALEEARIGVARTIGAEPREVVFVSGGTEADNLAIQGVGRAWIAAGRPPNRLITSAVEHPAVLETCRHLQSEGWSVTVLPVDSDGIVDPAQARRALAGGAALVSVMAANHETGVVQPVASIAKLAREAGVLMHVDAVQAAGRIPIDVKALGVDLLSLSAHKMGGPAGIGALFVREGVELRGLMLGGSQERRRRPGTESPVLAAGFVAAARAARERDDGPHIENLRDRMERELLLRIEGARVNGAGAPRLPNTSSLTISGMDNEALVIRMDLMGFALSTGSACSTGSSRPSHVLAAMGLSAADIASTIRISLGTATSASEIDALIEELPRAVALIRRASASGAQDGKAGRS